MLFEKKIATKAGLAAALLLAASASFAETSKDYTVSCSAGGFTGTAYVTAVRNGDLLSVFATDYKINSPRDAPINLLRSGGESQFARHPALFAENGLMQRALRAFPPGFPC